MNKEPYFMFLDDERDPPKDGNDWLVFRSSSHAIGFMMVHGLPSYISFDHDLGGKIRLWSSFTGFKTN